MIVSPFCFNIALWKRKEGREFNSETMLGEKSKKGGVIKGRVKAVGKIGREDLALIIS